MHKIKQFFTKSKDFSGEREVLSPYFKSDIEHEGITYPTVWHAYEGLRCEDVGDKWAISRAETKEVIKTITKDAERRYQTKVWDTASKNMKLLQRKKFSSDNFKKKLLDTYPAKLIFGNKDHEHFWGSCSKHLFAKGSNAMGKILMEIRDEYRSQGNGAVRRTSH